MITVISFLLAILILVTVHEFGHFWVAHKLGIKVLKFSVGFGKVLFSRTSKVDQTEFAISAIPLGGYVKMLDEREGEVEPHELDRAFNRQALWVRAAVVFAGPLFNFIFAVLAYWLVAMIGVNDIQPIIGKIDKQTIAAESLIQVDDKVLAIGQNKITGWKQAMEELIKQAMDGDDVEIELQRGIETYTTSLDATEFAMDPKKWLDNLGLNPQTPVILPVVAKVIPNSPAELAGIVEQDKILSIDGVLLNDWYDLVEIVKVSPGQELTLGILSSNDVQRQIKIIPEIIVQKDKNIGRIGIAPLVPQMPADSLLLVKYSPLQGLVRGVQQTVDISWLTVKMIWKMLTGQSSFSQNIGGPISIAQFAGDSFHAGFVSFIGFLALISISLGVLNLLPIPVLDGGHLLLYLVEFLKGSPVSESVELLFQKVGMTLIAALTFFAIYNDVNRLMLN